MASVERYTTAGGETRYMVRYRQPDGKSTKKRGFKRKLDAERALAQITVDKGLGAHVSPSAGQRSVADFHDAWWATKRYRKPSWRDRLDSIWRVHIDPTWGHRRVGSIERPEVQAWVNRLDDDDLAASTIADIAGVLQGLLDAAIEQRALLHNPARGVALPPRPHIDHDYLTAAQVEQLAAEVSRYPEIVRLLAYTGLRWGELAALRPRDIDIERRRIHITRSSSKRDKGGFEIVAPKTWETRSVGVPQAALDGLLPVIAAAGSPTALLWQREDGTPLRPPNPTSWFLKAVYRLALPVRGEDGRYRRDEQDKLLSTTGFPAAITAHKLRHTAASLMIASGASIKAVQLQLGHKNASMTLDRYGHLYADDLTALIDRMDTTIRAQNVPTEGSVPTDSE